MQTLRDRIEAIQIRIADYFYHALDNPKTTWMGIGAFVASLFPIYQLYTHGASGEAIGLAVIAALWGGHNGLNGVDR